MFEPGGDMADVAIGLLAVTLSGGLGLAVAFGLLVLAAVGPRASFEGCLTSGFLAVVTGGLTTFALFKTYLSDGQVAHIDHFMGLVLFAVATIIAFSIMLVVSAARSSTRTRSGVEKVPPKDLFPH
ncbi:MAG: hypothetical protein AAFX50_07080 [Acidobacteriota bacterium]